MTLLTDIQVMKKFLASLSIILALGSVCRADVWPDGSKMDKWFTSKGEKVSGKQARRFVLPTTE